jgi:two-component system LytT family response regulator
MHIGEINSITATMTLNFDQKSNMKALIVDDEFGAREVLKTLITDFFPSIEIVQECSNLPECVKAIHTYHPDLIFLDIEMPGYSGLELYEFLNEDAFHFEVIFTTAYQEYALDAFRLAAIDYLLKPIQFHQLKEAVDRFEAQHINKTAMQQLQLIQKHLSDPQHQEICVSTTEGKYYIPFGDLLYLEADGSYTNFYLVTGKRITASRRIKHFEELLTKDSRFLRVHRSYLVNKQHVERFKKGEDAHALLINQHKIPVSTDRLKELGL